MAREYKAFISYRHAEVDSRVASEVQRSLERFHIPSAVRKETGERSLAPIFRDKEELPVTSELSDDIGNALANARHLIVICSPRTSESSWVQREIETFLKTHPLSSVLTVLAEGEPYDVIPPILLKRPRMMEMDDGSTREVLVDAEPLSCDFRSRRKADHRPEITRLAAAMLGVPYDSLVRRQQRYRRRLAAAGITVVAADMLYGAWSLIVIRREYRETQISQSRTLARDAQVLYENGETFDAMEMALAALPGEGNDRPIVGEAELTLQQVSRAYVPLTQSTPLLRARPLDYDVARSFCLGHTIKGVDCSPDETLLAAWSYSGDIDIWNAQTGELVHHVEVKSNSIITVEFLDDDSLIVACSQALACIKAREGEMSWELASESASSTWDVDGQEEPSSLFLIGAGLDRQTGRLVALDDRVYLGNGERLLLHSVEDGSVQKVIRLGDIEGECDFYNQMWMEVGEGSCAIAWKPSSESEEDKVVTVDLESGKAQVSEDTFHEISDMTALPGGYVLVSSSLVAESGGRSTVWGTGNSPETVLHPHGERLSLLEVRTGKTVWACELDLWQVIGKVSAFPASIELGEGKAQDVLIWCGANVCAWLDPKSGELLGRIETPASFVSAWVRQAPGDWTEGYPSSIEGCLADGQYVVCSPLKKQSLSAKCYPQSVRLALSRGAGEFIACNDTVLLYTSGQGDSSWRLLTDSHFNYDEVVHSSRGLLAYDRYGTGHDNVPTLALFDLTQKEEVWETQLTFGDVGKSPMLVGLNSDQSAVVFRDDGGGSLLFVSLDDGDVTRLPITDRLTEGAQEESLCGRNPTLAGDYVVSTIRVEDGLSHCLCTTDLSTMESKVLAEVRDMSVMGAGSSSGKALMAVDHAENSGNGGFAYECVVLDPTTGETRELDAPVTNDLENLRGIVALDAVWGEDQSLYVATPSGVVAYGPDGTRRFSIETGEDDIEGMGLCENELWVCMWHDEQLQLAWYDTRSGRELGRCTPDLGLSSDNHGLLVRLSSTPADGAKEGARYVLQAGHVVATIDREGTTYQQVANCYGYDQASDTFLVATPNVISSGFGVYSRYSCEELVARAHELLGDYRMSDDRRRELGL